MQQEDLPNQNPQRGRAAISRRQWLQATAGLALGATVPTVGCKTLGLAPSKPDLRLSLAQWSVHKAHFEGRLDPLDFAGLAREEFGIEAVEYVNTFFKEHAEDVDYLNQLRQRAKEHRVESLLIMVDGEGNLGGEAAEEAVANHLKWIDAADSLGCHSIRVNAGGKGSRAEVARRAAKSLRQLADYGKPKGVSVIVENHGGYSSNGSWLAGVMRLADHPGVGTLPDFGNFRISERESYDRYKGVRELMPFAKAVSAKSHEFNAEGQEVHTDFDRMLRIVRAAGYKGFIGIEYEGSQLPEMEGIAKTAALLRSLGVV